MLDLLIQEIQALANPERASIMAKYFKTGKGQYAEGDQFIGLSNPQLRDIVRKFYRTLPPDAVVPLLTNPIHEYRLCGLMLWVAQFPKAPSALKEEIIALYLNHLTYINNWDLVDSSAYYLLGAWLLDKDRSLLYELAQRPHLWSQRVAMVSTLAFIRKGQWADTFRLASIFLTHPHDLMHKATGWMLREVGKKDELALREFLDEYCTQMPRTMLRYAIEKLPEKERQYYLRKKA